MSSEGPKPTFVMKLREVAAHSLPLPNSDSKGKIKRGAKYCLTQMVTVSREDATVTSLPSSPPSILSVYTAAKTRKQRMVTGLIIKLT